MTFNRNTSMSTGHRLYTSARAHLDVDGDYDTRGWIVAPPPDGDWANYDPKRIRRFRSPPRVPASEWTGSLLSVPRSGFALHGPNDGPSAAWLAERNAAGTAIKHGQNATRIERALVSEASPLVAALRQVKELMRPTRMATNDNTPSGDGEVNRGGGTERVHNQGSIEPSVPMLLRAHAAAFRPHVVTKKRQDGGNGRQRAIEKRHVGVIGFSFIEGTTLLGETDWRRKLIGLIFRNGELVAYGNDEGRHCRPAYKADPLGLVFDKATETAKHVAAQPDENRSYSRLCGAGVYLSHQHPSAPGAMEPSPRTTRAVANDNVLVAAIANTPCLPPVTKFSDGVAAEYGRLAGISESKGIGEGCTSAPMHEVLAELDRDERFQAVGIDEADLDVVDAVLDDASFRTIGLQQGYAESSSHRMGRKAVERALERISRKLAA